MTVPVKGGRPKAFKSKEELQKKIDKYYEYCEEKDKPSTFAGAAYFLEVDRQTLYNYKEKEEYFDTIKKLRDRIKLAMEERLADTSPNKTGMIFLAKNYGYTDKQEIDHTINAEVIIEE